MTAGPAVNRVPAAARVPFSASLSVTPTIANVNTPRLLRITAYFPLGCGPDAATATYSTTDGIRILEVRVDSPSPDFAFSDLVLVPYTVELTHAPSEAGDLPVRMMTADGVAVGESVVMTRSVKRADPQFAVTGKWIDVVSTETGLALVPDSPDNKTVIGTWNFHDHQGVCRRFSIQSVHWKTQNREAEGTIFETTPESESTPARAPLTAASQLGLARITFHSINSARIFALGFGGNVLFTSNLVRTTL